MPSNVEIKARANDWERLQRAAQDLAKAPGQMIEQEDVFFHVPTGRLKLRVFSDATGELIYYERPNEAGPRPSRYMITPIPQPAGLRESLAAALGIRGIVRKQRNLYLAGQTRIHLDEVEGSGRFVELEVVLRPEQTAEEGQRIAADLMARLGIATVDLVERAYVDLLLEAGTAANRIRAGADT